MVALNQNGRGELCMRIRGLLEESDLVDTKSLEVRDVDDAIRIEGIAHTVTSRIQAVELAESVAGSEQIISELRVLPVNMHDTIASPTEGDVSIAELIETKLQQEAALANCDLAVSVNGSQIRINGYVHSDLQKQLIQQIAANTDTEIRCNEIVVADEEFGESSKNP